jgi:hypothetical protein
MKVSLPSVQFGGELNRGSDAVETVDAEPYFSARDFAMGA